MDNYDWSLFWWCSNSSRQALRGDSALDLLDRPAFGALQQLGSASSLESSSTGSSGKFVHPTTLKHDHLKVAAAVDLSKERDHHQQEWQQQRRQQEHGEQHREEHREQHREQKREQKRDQQYVRVDGLPDYDYELLHVLSHPGSLSPSSGQHSNIWTDLELRRLHEAVENFGRDWKAVATYVGNRSNAQCHMKVDLEVRAGRMREPEGKQMHMVWTEDEYAKLVDAIIYCGRDWKAVAARVGTRTRQQCRNKVLKEVEAGRMEDPKRKPRGGQQRKCVAEDDELDTPAPKRVRADQ